MQHLPVVPEEGSSCVTCSWLAEEIATDADQHCETANMAALPEESAGAATRPLTLTEQRRLRELRRIYITWIGMGVGLPIT